MGYHPLSNDSGSSADERRAEATRIISILIENDIEVTQRESEFIDSISETSKPVSVKQLFWLRDIKDKYL